MNKDISSNSNHSADPTVFEDREKYDLITSDTHPTSWYTVAVTMVMALAFSLPLLGLRSPRDLLLVLISPLMIGPVAWVVAFLEWRG